MSTHLRDEGLAVLDSPDRGTLLGRTVLVTGGSTGIGLAVAKLFAHEGAAVVLLSLEQAEVERACNELSYLSSKVVGIVGDVTDPGDVAKAVRAAKTDGGGLHYAVNCAGIPQATMRIGEQTESDYDRIFAVDVKGVWISMKYEIPAILAAGGGAIVNIASAAGLKGFPQQALYCGAKHAVVGLTRSLALDHATEGVRINAVAPGAVNTEMLQTFAAENVEQWPGILARRPMGKLAEPAEVASAVLFLCRDATNTTGAVVPVDGGLLA